MFALAGIVLVALFSLVALAAINYVLVVAPRKQAERVALGWESGPRHRKVGRHAA